MPAQPTPDRWTLEWWKEQTFAAWELSNRALARIKELDDGLHTAHARIDELQRALDETTAKIGQMDERLNKASRWVAEHTRESGGAKKEEPKQAAKTPPPKPAQPQKPTS